MKLLITGHRRSKLNDYNRGFIQQSIYDHLYLLSNAGYVRGYAGMASGVDLWFCDSCRQLKIPYVACVPFDEQDQTMDQGEKIQRAWLLEEASETRNVKNSWMVEQVTHGLVVWDGNKGGTHNVVQQLVEAKKGFWWINPVSEKIWECL